MAVTDAADRRAPGERRRVRGRVGDDEPADGASGRVDQLSNVQAKFVGAVLNRVDLSTTVTTTRSTTGAITPTTT